MENIGGARLMLDKSGPENVPHFTGLSVHNQRIERLWRDAVNYIVQHYRDLFEFLENIGILDPLNECELFVLHLIYLPLLEKDLEDFMSFWNNHKLRTEGALTLVQIWMQGVYCNLMNDTVKDTVDLSDFDPTNYGVDEEASIPLDDIQTGNNVVVPSCPFQLSEEEITTLNKTDVFAHDGNTGINSYLQVVDLLRTFESIE